jgi:hypothetical protein
MKRKTTLLLVGFFLFLFGFLAFFIQIIGLQFQFLVWIDALGSLVGFLIRMLMIVTGFVLAYFGLFDFEAENKEIEAVLNQKE